MGTHVVSTAGFKYGAGPTTVNLGSRLHDLTYAAARTRYVAESDDLTLREVVTVGSAVKEITGTIRFHDDPDELQDMIDAGLDGTQLDYYPDIDAGTHYDCTLIEASEITPDREAPAGIPTNPNPMYQVTLTLRAVSPTTDFSGLAGLP